MKYSSLILLLLFPIFIFAQRIGKIEDAATGNGLGNVNIINLNSEFGTVSNSNGDYNLGDRTAETDSIQFSFVGYQTEIFTLSELKNRNFIVLMFQKKESLDDITISEKGKLRPSLRFQKLNDLPKAICYFSFALTGNELYLFGGTEAEFHNKSGEVQDRMFMSNQSFSDYLKAMRLNRNFDYVRYNSAVLVYDFETENWAAANFKALDRIEQQSQFLNNKIYTFGGKTASLNGKKEFLTNIIEVYDPISGKLEEDKMNPHMAVNFTSFTHDSLLFLAGGSTKVHTSTQLKEYSNKVHVFDPETGLWKEMNPMPEAKETNGIKLNNKFYFIGGEQEGRAIPYIEYLDLDNGKWKRIGKLFEPVRKPSLSSDGNYIYIYTSGKITVLNPRTEDIKEYKIEIAEHEPGMLIKDDQLFIFGGYIAKEFEFYPSNHLYKVPLSEFSRTRIQQAKSLEM